MSQPAVSLAIADLEAAIGVRLLDRHANGVTPTPYGEALLKREAEAFDALRQGIRDIEFLADPMAGEVRVGCPETLAAGFLPAVIEQFSRKYPKVVFHVIQANTVTLQFEELRSRTVDVVLARLSRPLAEDDLKSETFFDDHLVVVAGAHNKWTRRRRVRLADLVDEPWIFTPPNSLPRSLVEQAFRAEGLALPTPRVATFSQHIVSRLLVIGDYLTVSPATLLRFSMQHFPIKALPVRLSVPPRPIAAVTLRNRTLTPMVSRFIDAIRDARHSIPSPRK